MEQFKFIKRDLNSSVYKEVSRYLIEERKDWRKVHPNSAFFDLMFGDRNKLPFGRLGHDPGRLHMVNYYRGSDALCRKSALVKIFKQYCDQVKYSYPEWLPLTYRIFPKNVKQTSIRNSTFLVRSEKPDDREEMLEMDKKLKGGKGKTVWIAKSSAGAKGEGIKISADVAELVDYIDDQDKAFVIQRYIERPFLLTGNRKFDIRCWILVDTCYEVYLFREGVLRTSSESYNPNDLNNVTSHLTNHCLQQELSGNYGKYEEGNEMFFEEFNRYLMKTKKTNIEASIIPQIKDIVKKCFFLVEEKIKTNGLGYVCFQLFGFDFLLDEDLKVWLIEVNGAPACAEFLLPHLARSIVLTAIDPVFQPSEPPVGDSWFVKVT